MSMYDDVSADDRRVAALEQELADLRSQVAPLVNRQKMTAAVDVEAFGRDLAATDSPEAALAVIRAANVAAYEAVHGVGSAAGVEL